MSSHYEYTPYIWPMLLAAAAVAALAAYAWRRRSVPAARSLAVLMAFGVPWALGAALELSAVGTPAKVFWFTFHSLWQLPAATASLWFALEYSDPGRWLTRPRLGLLVLPPVLVALLMLTNGTHHLFWASFRFDGQVRAELTAAGTIALGYGLILALATVLVFLRLAIKSPLHRPAAALCLGGQLLTRLAFAMDTAGSNPAAPMDLTVLAFPFTVGLYALALFRFHMFEVIPVSQGDIIDQIREGMLVLNTSGQILDLNPAAEKMLGLSGSSVRGCRLSHVLPDYPELAPPPDAREPSDSEIRFQLGGDELHYVAHHTPILHRHGFSIGSVLLLCDVSRERQAQAQLLEEQRAVATLRERDRVARELHDSLGQVVGYAKMQAQAARALLAQGRAADAGACLAQLVSAAQDAHDDVRDYIHGARAGVSADSPFIWTLEQYLDRFAATYGIDAKLELLPGLGEEAFEPMVGSQLLRIIQEALSNVRKHAGARHVRVRIGFGESCTEAIIQDDGAGFDPALLETPDGRKYGLRFMHERAQEIGACVCIRSAPGQGAQVVVTIPQRKVAHEGLAG